MRFIVFALFSLIAISACIVQRTPDEQFKYAQELFDKGEFAEALEALQAMPEMLPNDDNLRKALFLRGYIYANHLQKLDSAQVIYERFLRLYPEHELAPSVRFELDYLGANPEDFLQQPNALEKQSNSAKN
jgi:outer membrane protein assembly factor BamD (BamD/ComL family)